jgi:hypothetical protein
MDTILSFSDPGGIDGRLSRIQGSGDYMIVSMQLLMN